MPLQALKKQNTVYGEDIENHESDLQNFSQLNKLMVIIIIK